MKARFEDFEKSRPRRPSHPYAWLWEPMENDPTFLLRAMFGAQAAYLDGRLQLCFMAKAEPWRGILVCTDQLSHASLRAEFPVLRPHKVLAKWLYLPETAAEFEAVAQRLVRLALRRDPRLGVTGTGAQKKKQKRPLKIPSDAHSSK